MGSSRSLINYDRLVPIPCPRCRVAKITQYSNLTLSSKGEATWPSIGRVRIRCFETASVVTKVLPSERLEIGAPHIAVLRGLAQKYYGKGINSQL